MYKITPRANTSRVVTVLRPGENRKLDAVNALIQKTSTTDDESAPAVALAAMMNPDNAVKLAGVRLFQNTLLYAGEAGIVSRLLDRTVELARYGTEEVKMAAMDAMYNLADRNSRFMYNTHNLIDVLVENGPKGTDVLVRMVNDERDLRLRGMLCEEFPDLCEYVTVSHPPLRRPVVLSHR